jgi:predicted enzyme related to lactoylglutathione lyase
MAYRARAAAVLYAKDHNRVCAFYAGVLGLTVDHADEEYAVLESPLFQLVILAVPTSIAASIEIADPPHRREDTPIKLVFFVPSISAARSAAAHLGGELNPAAREWDFQGQRVCDGHDPEGNVIQFREISEQP